MIGALIGGVVNLATNWRNCDGVWQYIAAFGARAANGALSAALPGWGSLIGGAISGASNNIISQTGKNFSSKGSFDSSSFWTSVASGGFLGGFAGGALSKGSDINMTLKAGLNGAITGAAIGGVSGIANGIVESRANNVDFWTGKTSQSNPSSLTTQSATNTKANQMEAQSPVQKGKAGVEKASLELEAEGYTLLSHEITVEVNGVRIRLDIAMYKDGNVYLVEVKNGPHAGFTPNQKSCIPTNDRFSQHT